MLAPTSKLVCLSIMHVNGSAAMHLAARAQVGRLQAAVDVEWINTMYGARPAVGSDVMPYADPN